MAITWKYRILKFLSFKNKGKVAIFVNKKEDLDSVAGILKEVCNNSKGNFRLTSFDIELPAYFQDLNIEMDYSWDYLSEEDYAYVDNFFFKKLARSWFLFETFPQDYMDEYKKRLLGKCTEWTFIVYNSTLIKYIEVIHKIFINYRPTKILIIEDRPYLVNIVKLFKDRYSFKFLRINPESKPILNRLRALRKTIKVILVDLAILLLDFFVLHCVFMFKKFENKIIIDHRLYKKFAPTKLKAQLLICPFERGLKVRLQMLSKGLFYLPFREPSYFNFFQHPVIFKVRKEWNKIKSRPDIKDTFKYKDVIFWDAIEKYISQTILVTFPRIMANISTFQRFVQKKKVKLIVMRNDNKELERTLIEAARPLKIPNLVIQHGLMGNFNTDDTVTADTTAVWGEGTIDWFKQFGYQDGKFVVTGNPIYDELYYRLGSDEHQANTKKKICQKLQLNLNKKIVTFLTSSNLSYCGCFVKGNAMNFMLRAILKAIKSLPEIQLIVKLHPYDENLHLYNNIIKDFNLDDRVVTVKDVNIFDILEISDLVITVESSSGLEALILDKPLIAFRIKNSATIIPYVEEGVAIGARNDKEVESAIKDGLYNEQIRDNLKVNRRKFVFNQAYKIDGQATKRVEELMYKLMNNNGILTSMRDRNEYLVSKSSI